MKPRVSLSRTLRGQHGQSAGPSLELGVLLFLITFVVSGTTMDKIGIIFKENELKEFQETIQRTYKESLNHTLKYLMEKNTELKNAVQSHEKQWQHLNRSREKTNKSVQADLD